LADFSTPKGEKSKEVQSREDSRETPCKINIHLTLEEKMKNNPGPFVGLKFVQVFFSLKDFLSLFEL
jgi:hypothetical protein